MPHHRQANRRFLATVLFTDIVRSTERAAELGDRAWRDLLERHHAVVRRQLKTFGGREMDTAGDGFFAVFEAPERAVRCAESIIVAVAALGLAVRAGVHTGECEVIGHKVGGMAVTIGARVAALAGPAEVLVSGSARDLMTGSGARFDGGDPQPLKGVRDPWRVYRLVPQQRDGSSAARARASVVPLYTRRQWRRLVLAITAVTVVAVGVSTAYLVTRTEPGVAVGENTVGVIGPGNPVEVSAAVLVGQRPTALAGDDESVWVTNSTADAVSRIDRRTKVVSPISVGSSPSGIAIGRGAVWVANSGDATVSRIGLETPRPTRIPVRPGPTGVVVAFGSVWVTNALDASVTVIDPATNRVRRVVPVGAGPFGIARGAGALWVTNQGDGTVTRIDPATLRTETVTVGRGPTGIAFGAGAVWVANNLDGSLSRIDVEDHSVTSRALDRTGGAYGVAVHGDNVWVSNENAGTLMRVNASTFQLSKTVRVSGSPLGLAFVGNDLWFTSAEGGSALHRGGVLKLVGRGILYPTGEDPAVMDPTLEYDSASFRLAYLMHDGLVGVRRSGGVRGSEIVPDLATTLPEATDGGLTYTFLLRAGVKYSTGKRVVASDVRRGIERSIVHPTSGGWVHYGVIVGGQACKTAAAAATKAGRPLPDCDLSKGIVTDDISRTITFHLTKPTPEFVYQLTLPNADAVPQDTPTELTPGTFLPTTGPYRVASYTPSVGASGGQPALHGRLELVRNTYFHVWSPAAQPAGYPDRIVLETGFTDHQSAARVKDGRDDALWVGASQSLVNSLENRYSSQLHTNSGVFVNYLALNATAPPFASRAARRAVAFALDRRTMARTIPGRVTCQLIPPDFPAYNGYCPFTAGERTSGRWSAPDRAAARTLVKRSGTLGADVVVAVFDDPPWRRAGKQVVALLTSLGYSASLDVHGFDEYFDFVQDPHNAFNVALSSSAADYPSASNYVATLGSCNPRIGTFNLSAYCDRALDRRMLAAVVRQPADPAGASLAWSRLDRAVVDAAATIPFSVEVHQDFVSRRVGHVLVDQGTGLLVSQLWVQ